MLTRKSQNIATLLAAGFLLYLSVGNDSALPRPLSIEGMPVIVSAAPQTHDDVLGAMPQSERAYVSLVEQSQRLFVEAGDDPAKLSAAKDVLHGISQAVPTTSADNWIGTLKEYTRADNGDAYVKIELADDIVISTTRKSAVGDNGYPTLVKYGSQLFSQLSELNEGARVKFSAQLIRMVKDDSGERRLAKPGVIARFRTVSILG